MCDPIWDVALPHRAARCLLALPGILIRVLGTRRAITTTIVKTKRWTSSTCHVYS